MSASTTFRLATHADLDDLAVFVNAAYRGDSSRVGWTTEADFLDGQRTDPSMLREMIVNDRSVLLLAHQSRQLVGNVFLERRDDGVAYLGMLTVKPNAQGGGLGKFILQAAEQWVQDNWRSHTLCLSVLNKRPELMDWYRRRGYFETGAIEPFPTHDSAYGIPKVENLELVMFSKKLESQP